MKTKRKLAKPHERIAAVLLRSFGREFLKAHCTEAQYQGILADILMPDVEAMGMTHLGRPSIIDSQKGGAIVTLLETLQTDTPEAHRIDVLQKALGITYVQSCAASC